MQTDRRPSRGGSDFSDRKMESEHERSSLSLFPLLEDGTLGTTWTKGHFLHFGEVSKEPELDCCFSK